MATGHICVGISFVDKRGVTRSTVEYFNQSDILSAIPSITRRLSDYLANFRAAHVTWISDPANILI